MKAISYLLLRHKNLYTSLITPLCLSMRKLIHSSSDRFCLFTHKKKKNLSNFPTLSLFTPANVSLSLSLSTFPRFLVSFTKDHDRSGEDVIVQRFSTNHQKIVVTARRKTRRNCGPAKLINYAGANRRRPFLSRLFALPLSIFLVSLNAPSFPLSFLREIF